MTRIASQPSNKQLVLMKLFQELSPGRYAQHLAHRGVLKKLTPPGLTDGPPEERKMYEQRRTKAINSTFKETIFADEKKNRPRTRFLPPLPEATQKRLYP